MGRAAVRPADSFTSCVIVPVIESRSFPGRKEKTADTFGRLAKGASGRFARPLVAFPNLRICMRRDLRPGHGARANGRSLISWLGLLV